jgi:hypothetical protein
MTNFSTNQVMQFYALDGLKNVTATVKPYGFDKACKVLFTKGDDKYTSDKIENVMWGKVTTAAALKGELVSASVDFAGDVVAGEDYVVRVSYPEVGGAGIEAWTTKTAVAHASKGSAKEDVILDLKKQLEAVLAIDSVLSIGDTEAGGIKVSPNTNALRYERGIRPIVVPEFKVAVNQITDEGELVDWAVLTDDKQIPTTKTASPIATGYKVADMEYFAMGERADEYRMVGYPDYVKTDYIVDPTANYNVLVVHFAYKGANSDSHKSEKDFIVAAKDLTALETLAKAIADATGVEFTKVTETGEAKLVTA